MSHKPYYTQAEVFKLLNLTYRQQLIRLVKRYNIKTSSSSKTSPTFYNKQDIDNIVNNTAIPIKQTKATPKPKPPLNKTKTQPQATQHIQEVKPQATPSTKTHKVLNAIGQKLYEDTKQHLIKQKTYQDIDEINLLAYAISYQNYLIHSDKAQKDDFGITVDDMGVERISPHVELQQKYYTQMTTAKKALGLDVKDATVLRGMFGGGSDDKPKDTPQKEINLLDQQYIALEERKILDDRSLSTQARTKQIKDFWAIVDQKVKFMEKQKDIVYKKDVAVTFNKIADIFNSELSILVDVAPANAKYVDRVRERIAKELRQWES